MSHVVAIDPGIDAAGVACFDLRDWRKGESFAQAVARLSQYRVLRTQPATPLAERLTGLYTGLQDVLRDHQPERVYVEAPAIAGAYYKRRGRQYSKTAVNAADMAKLYLAIGVLVGAAAGELLDVVFVPASRVEKKLRLQLVLAQLRAQGHPLALHRRPSPDLLDAIFVGATALTDPQYQPVLSP
jgi:hypothetical protein